MSAFRIITDELSLEDVMTQLQAVNEFPASIGIYDRVIVISNKEEMWAFRHGVEIGWYTAEEKEEHYRAREKHVTRTTD